MKLHFYLIFFLFFTAGKVVAEDSSKNKDKKNKNNLEKIYQSVQISATYVSGEYLVFDCQYRHFVCVDEFSFKDCQERRINAYNKRHFILPCVPLKQFKDYHQCVQIHYKKMYQLANKDFCFAKTSVLKEYQ